MNKIMLISQESASDYLIRRSFLEQKSTSLLEVLNALSCIQVDPINVIARSHELALYNRIHNFQSQDLQTALYNKRQLFEYWLQLYSIIPIDSFPYTIARRQPQEAWHQEFARIHHEQLNQVRLYIKEHGPTSSFDLSHIQRGESLFTWSNSKSNTGLLSYLWDIGEVMVHHREKNRKYYDFTWKILDQKYLKNTSMQVSKDFFLNSFFKYVGILRPAMLTNRVGYARSLDLRALCAQWLEKGKITQVKIGISPTTYYIRTQDLDNFSKITPCQQIINILPPLDPLVIDRKLLQDVFNFNYLWEAYTPPKKRLFGYYGMPILYKGKFVGQIELKKDLNKHKLIIHNAQLPQDIEFKSELRSELTKLELFVFPT